MIASRRVVIEKDLTPNMLIDEAGMFRVQWMPAPPRALTREQLELYMRGRNEIVREALGLRADLALGAYSTASWE